MTVMDEHYSIEGAPPQHPVSLYDERSMTLTKLGKWEKCGCDRG